MYKRFLIYAVGAGDKKEYIRSFGTEEFALEYIKEHTQEYKRKGLKLVYEVRYTPPASGF